MLPVKPLSADSGGAAVAPRVTPLRRSRATQLALDLLALTKPRVQSLLLLTTIAAMYIAGDPSIWLVVATCIGGYLSAGGAGAVNHWYDRDIDARMARTSDRPIPSGRIAPNTALIFGVTLGLAAFVWLTLTTNVLTATLSFSGFVGYTVFYTAWLKRRTWQNIVWGGAAGAVPPLVGWAAVTGEVSGLSIYLFAVVFFWTPPHFWALALLMKDEYAQVGVPMLPVVRGERDTRRQIMLYAVLLYAVTQLPFSAGAFGLLYLISSLALNAGLCGLALRLLLTPSRRSALRLYLFSLLYLALLFAAMVADVKL